MRLCLAGCLLALGMACAMRDPNAVKTQVVTYPDGALVEIDGRPAGRAPASVVLPQDAEGRLTARATVRALPNTKQDSLYAQTRVFDPTNRAARVPNQIMIDMRQPGPGEPVELRSPKPGAADGKPGARRAKIPYTERGKPTQAVGLDRWDPGRR